MLTDKELTNPNVDDYLKLHYWPSLKRFNEAMDAYKISEKNKTLNEDHPILLELYNAQTEWMSKLHGLNFVMKMCKDELIS